MLQGRQPVFTMDGSNGYTLLRPIPAFHSTISVQLANYIINLLLIQGSSKNIVNALSNFLRAFPSPPTAPHPCRLNIFTFFNHLHMPQFPFLNRPDGSCLGLQLVPASLEHSVQNRLATILFLERYCYLGLHQFSTCHLVSQLLEGQAGQVWFATALPSSLAFFHAVMVCLCFWFQKERYGSIILH